MNNALGHTIRCLSIFLFFFFPFFLSSCESFNCPLNNSVACLYNFYAAERSDNGTLKTGTSVTVSDTITISAIDLDSVIVNRAYNVGSVSLPMSYYNAADSLCWTYTDAEGRTGTDTIIVYKTNIHHFDDPSCPVHIWHHIDSIYFSRNVIDTIVVANADVNYDGLENFQIYFRTSASSEETEESEESEETNNE